MDRERFIRLAGGIPQAPQPYDYHARKVQQKYFWRFFAKSKWRKSVKAAYSDLAVDILLRKRIYSIEHIVPKSYLRSYLYRVKQPTEIIQSAINNPFNYVPSHRKVNACRSSLPYDIENEDIVKAVHVNRLGKNVVGMDHEGEWGRADEVPRILGESNSLYVYLIWH